MMATTEGQSRLSAGVRKLNHAKYLAGIGGPSFDEAELVAREALRLLRSAMNWLEGSEKFEDAHRQLDAAGHWVRTTFSCSLTQAGESYEITCPVALAHNRSGFSVGYVIKQAECSICGQDPEGCPHINGREYDGERCVRVVTEAELLEVSLVGAPRNPDARIESMSVSTQDLRAQLGPDWRPGMRVSCDRCLNECTGISWPFMSGGS
jgi:hypothetical protein